MDTVVPLLLLLLLLLLCTLCALCGVIVVSGSMGTVAGAIDVPLLLLLHASHLAIIIILVRERERAGGAVNMLFSEWVHANGHGGWCHHLSHCHHEGKGWRGSGWLYCVELNSMLWGCFGLVRIFNPLIYYLMVSVPLPLFLATTGGYLDSQAVFEFNFIWHSEESEIVDACRILNVNTAYKLKDIIPCKMAQIVGEHGFPRKGAETLQFQHTLPASTWIFAAIPIAILAVDPNGAIQPS
ncbi:hypothetical protein HD554DRAFT_2041118 [Boletus coccyginus]|nr:hypothetical protein HD554DRAFT_2041118 [Boletus coccyginus]